MAYVAKNFSVLAYANGFTLWHYKTPDTTFDVDAAGYFNAAAYMIHVGDIVLANTETGGEIRVGIWGVSSNEGGDVKTCKLL